MSRRRKPPEVVVVCRIDEPLLSFRGRAIIGWYRWWIEWRENDGGAVRDEWRVLTGPWEGRDRTRAEAEKWVRAFATGELPDSAGGGRDLNGDGNLGEGAASRPPPPTYDRPAIDWL